MEITWDGHFFFRLTEGNIITMVIDLSESKKSWL